MVDNATHRTRDSLLYLLRGLQAGVRLGNDSYSQFGVRPTKQRHPYTLRVLNCVGTAVSSLTLIEFSTWASFQPFFPAWILWAVRESSPSAHRL